MASKHMEVKHKLQNIARIKEFEDLLDASMLTEQDKYILRAIYLENKSLSFIGDKLGYSIYNIKRIHKKQ